MTSTKKVGFISSRPPLPIEGATRSMFERLFFLRELGWEPSILATAERTHAASLAQMAAGFEIVLQLAGERLCGSWRQIPITIALGENYDTHRTTTWSPSFDALSRLIDETSPRVLLFNMRDYVAAQVARRLPCLGYVTEDEFPRPAAVGDSDDVLPNAALFRNHKNIAVASDFLATSYEAAWGIRPQVFSNTLDLTPFLALPASSSARTCITMMHPFVHKGVDIVVSLAERFPGRSFLIGGGVGAEYRALKERVAGLPNLRALPFQPDPTELYRRSKIVLVPSRWQEGFSRVVLEAMAAGCAVISSATGGLKTTGGTAALYAPVDPISNSTLSAAVLTQWAEQLVRLDDPEFLREQLNRGYSRVETYIKERDRDLERLDQYLAEQLYRKGVGSAK